MKGLTSIEGMVMRQLGGNRNAVAFWKQRRKMGARIGRPPRRKNGDAMATDPTASAEVVLSS